MHLLAASAGIFQNNCYVPLKYTNVMYLRKTTKAAGSGRKVKYAVQEAFIIKYIIT